jgi:hypothetical protein
LGQLRADGKTSSVRQRSVTPPSLPGAHLALPRADLLCHSARLAYSFLFFLAILISWAGRDLAKPLIEKIPCKLWFWLYQG